MYGTPGNSVDDDKNASPQFNVENISIELKNEHTIFY